MLIGCASQPIDSLPTPTIPQTSQQLDLQAQHLNDITKVSAFQLNGRIAVQMEKQGFSANTHWQHAKTHDLMEVFSPFGSKLAVINSTAQQVTLTTADQKQLTADNVETLTQQALGFKLPLLGLSEWVLGKPSSHGEPPTIKQYNALGQLVKLSQQGWDIDYSDYQMKSNVEFSVHLPGKIFLKSPKLNLKLLVESWQLNPQSQTAP